MCGIGARRHGGAVGGSARSGGGGGESLSRAWGPAWTGACRGAVGGGGGGGCARGRGRRWCWSANDAFISPPPTRRPSLLRSYGPATSPQGGGELKCIAPERGAPLTPPHPDPLPQGGRGQYGAKRHH